jgi:hypothetical protein
MRRAGIARVARLAVPVVERVDAEPHADAAQRDLARARVVDDVVWVAGTERQQRKPVVAGAERVCDARRRRACPFTLAWNPLAARRIDRGGRPARLSDGHRIRCLPRRRAHLDGACRDNASCLRFSSEATLASSSSMSHRAAPIACLRASHQPRARRSLRTTSRSAARDCCFPTKRAVSGALLDGSLAPG